MSKSEVKGLVNLMILTAASHLEGFLVELIRLKLMWPLLSLKGPTVFPPKKVTSSTMVVLEEPKDLAPFGGTDVVTTEVNFDEEQKIICAVVDQWISSLEGEPFGKLRERMELTIGSSFGLALGEDRACEIDLLFDLRNLIAHGRDAYVPVELSGIPFPKFDASPLNKAVNVLRKRQLLPNQASKALTAYEMIDCVFSLEVAAFLFESSRQAELKLLQLPVFRAGPLFHAPQALPQISPASAS